MTCQDRELQLEDYVDGELEPQDRVRVERHLTGCRGCREAVAEIRTLAADARRLPQIPPGRDLFPVIRRRLERHPSRAAAARTRWIAWAAALLVVILGGTTALWLGRGPTLEATSGPAAQPAMQHAAQAVDPAVRDYIQAAELLTSAIRARRDRVSPDTLEILDKNLAIIDEAIEQLRVALESAAAGPADTKVLRAMHAQKLQLLLRFNEIIS